MTQPYTLISKLAKEVQPPDKGIQCATKPGTLQACPTKLPTELLTYFLIVTSPVTMSRLHSRGSGSNSFPSPISSGVHR